MNFQPLLSFLCLSILFVFNTGDKLGLYDDSDDVIILNGTNFARRLYGSDRAWIVEFYNTWCGHCAKFAPKWKRLATELKDWRPVISIGAIDCAEQMNMGLCRHYGVHAFPNFKLFKPYSDDTDLGEEWRSQDMNSLVDRMIDFVSDTTALKVPLKWPTLQPLQSVDHIWDHVQDKHTHVALVFEEEDSYIGRKVILDTFQHPHLLVRRMLKGSVRKYGITEFPSMYLITRDGMFERLAKNVKTREGFVNALMMLRDTEGFFNALLEVLPGKNNTLNKNSAQIDGNVAGIDRKVMANIGEKKAAVYMRDLESTLHYAFRQEIALHRDIDGERLSALKTFVKILVKYFPGRHVVNDLLARISDWLSDVTELTGEVWLNSVDNLQTLEAYIPDHVEWIGCQGSEPKYRGYPCGMWTLFHALTVSVYTTQRQGPRDVPPDILGAIANYMKYFFGCQTCVEHFLKMASYIKTADRQPRNAILWLWRGHNMANNRLHGDPTEDPKHLKVQFPTRDICPQCYSGAENFDEDSVLEFLLKFYGAKNIVKYKEESEEDYSDVHNNEDTQKGDNQKQLDWWELHQRKQALERVHSLHMQKHHQKPSRWGANRQRLSNTGDRDFEFQEGRSVIHGWGFSNLDMGMCITFYLMCTLIIVLLYYHFIVRRKYKPFRIFSM